MEYWKENVNYRKLRQPDGTVRHLIRIGNEDMEVSEELYQEYSRMERRERYLKERDAGVCLSLDQFSEDELSGDYLMDCCEQNAETVMLDRMDLYEQQSFARRLPQAILSLPEAEQRIIRALYLDGQSERNVARMLGVSQPAVHKRQARILKKLLTLLQKDYF